MNLAIDDWLTRAGITERVILRRVKKGRGVEDETLHQIRIG